jgi:hypothetical protein
MTMGWVTALGMGWVTAMAMAMVMVMVCLAALVVMVEAILNGPHSLAVLDLTQDGGSLRAGLLLPSLNSYPALHPKITQLSAWAC